MNFTDNSDMHGEVVISLMDSEGNCEVVVDDRNLIVFNGRKCVANNVLNASSTYINGIKFGSNGTAVGDPNAVKPVLPSESTFVNNIPNLVAGTDYVFSVDSSTLTGTIRPKLIYSCVIPKNRMIGLSLNEMALMLTDDTVFALKRFATITKSSSVSMSISWTLYF